jgi:hypothetical protein
VCHRRAHGPTKLAPPATLPPPPAKTAPAQQGVLHSVAAAGPVVGSVKESHRSWREGGKSVHVSSARPPVGTVFSFTLNEHAQMSFTFTQRVSGRRVNGRCVAATSANRSAPTCKRTVIRGALYFAAHGGPNSLAFQGKLSRTRKLSAGAYELTIVATSATRRRSAPKALSFTIVG